MKKLLALFLAVLFISGAAYADTAQTAGENVVIFSQTGAKLTDPPMMIRLVRYGKYGDNENDFLLSKLTSGDAVCWNTASHDGLTVSLCSAITDQPKFAGVLVTDLLTQDVGSSTTEADDNYGYMAVKGYCLADVDTSEATAGQSLQISVPDTSSTTITNEMLGAFDTRNNVATDNPPVSRDIGVLLVDPGADGLGIVELY